MDFSLWTHRNMWRYCDDVNTATNHELTFLISKAATRVPCDRKQVSNPSNIYFCEPVNDQLASLAWLIRAWSQPRSPAEGSAQIVQWHGRLGVARFIDISRYFSRNTYRDIICYNCIFFFPQWFSFRQKKDIIISTCDFCKVIPQIQLFCENNLWNISRN